MTFRKRTQLWKCVFVAVLFVLTLLGMYWISGKTDLVTFERAPSLHRIYDSPLPREAQKWSLTICSIMYDSLPYLFEWIEFHRLQGVDHFVIYDDGGEDRTYLLPEFYASRGLPNLVEVIPIRQVYKGSIIRGVEQLRERQGEAMEHCVKTYENKTKWILAIDVDEFVYSVQKDSLWKYIEERPEKHAKVTQYHIQAVRFGTSGLKDDNFTSLVREDKNERLKLKFSDNSTVPLLIESCTRRAPHPDLDSIHQMAFNAICGEAFGIHCGHALGKNLFRPAACGGGQIHFCKNLLFGETLMVNLDEVRLDHFPFRSENHFNKQIMGYDAHKVEVFHMFDKKWFSAVSDFSKIKFFSPIRTVLKTYTS